ncbi:MAG TPA: DUF4164 family protein [Caulobacteraceae bacterium]|nr:DUF4164 family protein [Caulobacteraceae bacterium]
MAPESDVENALDIAVRRLERATALLESRLEGLAAKADSGGAFDQDRAMLAEELDAARGRERALTAAGEDAARALDRAITEISQVLGARAGKEV